MTRHVLKVDFKYANAILNGKKSFEVRKNDRNFMVGDEIVFKVLIDKGSYAGAEAVHPLNGTVYRMCKDGELMTVRTPGSIRICRDMSFVLLGLDR